MALERCDVETWAEFGSVGLPCSAKVVFGSPTDVFLCDGCDEIYVFSTKERKITVVLQVPGPVSDLVQSQNKGQLYIACPCGVYCVDLPALLSSSSSRPVEVEVSSEFLVVPEKGASSLLSVGSELAMISRTNSHWMLTLYRSQGQTGAKGCEMLASFSLPLASDSNEGAAVKRRPVLSCVHYSAQTPSSVRASTPETAIDGHFCIDPILFKLLFGIDAALAGSPVVLCGLPDGCLYFLPLGLPGSRPRALCSLEQPVIFVGASSIDKRAPEHAQCLVAMGEQGRVVLIRTRKEKEACAVWFLDRCLPGSLVCGCIVKNTLYYSAGSDFLKLDLSSGSFGGGGQNGEQEASRTTEAPHRSPASLNVCGIVAVAELKSKTAGGDTRLLGLSVGGQLRRIAVRGEAEGAGPSRGPTGPTVQMGRSVKDQLSAIGDVCERACVLSSALSAKGQVLKQLNHVMNVSLLLSAAATTGERPHTREKPIRCRALAEWRRSLQKDSLNLTCVLDNSSPYTLERGWALSLSVSPLSCPPSEGGTCSSTNFSFPFQNLNPGESLEVSLPLADAGEAFLPCMVSCSLIFSLSSLLPAEEASWLGVRRSCFGLPLNALCVDWLHALQLNGPEAAREKDTAQLTSTTMGTIQAFIKSHRLVCGGADEGRGPDSTPEQYSASVQVSSELLDSAVGLKSSGVEGQGHNRCASFLEWLLSEGCGGVRRGRTTERISRPVLYARGPNGHAVTLTAKEVNVDEGLTGAEGSLTTVVLQMESSFMAAVCGLHHAVLRRLQHLLQTAAETAPPVSVRGSRLRQTMLRVETFVQQIQHSRFSGAFSVGASGPQMTQSLHSIYRDLRENPLIIL